MSFFSRLNRQVTQPVAQLSRQFEFFSFYRTPQFFFQSHFFLDQALGRVGLTRRGPSAMARGAVNLAEQIFERSPERRIAMPSAETSDA